MHGIAADWQTEELDFHWPCQYDCVRITDRNLVEPLGAVLSPFLTVEEAYLLASAIRELDSEAVLALGARAGRR